MNIKRITASILLALTMFGSAFAGLTPEEAAVRETYAKIAYAARLEDLHGAIAKDKKNEMTLGDLESKLAESELKFQISKVSVGSISQVAQTRFSQLVTKPDGSDVLAIAPAQLVFTEDLANDFHKETKENHAAVQWTRGQRLSEDWDVPLENVVSTIKDGNTYTRYAGFTVNVSYQLRSRDYNAMFLFGTDKGGNAVILALDNVTNNSALKFFAKEDVYPAVLLETPMKPVRDWLTAHQVDDAECKGGKKVCCDPFTLRCGVPSSKVKSALQ